MITHTKPVWPAYSHLVHKSSRLYQIYDALDDLCHVQGNFKHLIIQIFMKNMMPNDHYFIFLVQGGNTIIISWNVRLELFLLRPAGLVEPKVQADTGNSSVIKHLWTEQQRADVADGDGTRHFTGQFTDMGNVETVLNIKHQ